MKNTLLALALATFALGSHPTLALADPGVPAAFSEERQPTAEELAEGTPLAAAINQIKAVKADIVATKANPKSTEKLDAVWATMTPELKKSYTRFGKLDIRAQAYIYQVCDKADLDPKTMEINILASDEKEYIFIGLSCRDKVTRKWLTKRTFVMKKTDKGWLECTLNEVPDALVNKTGYRK